MKRTAACLAMLALGAGCASDEEQPVVRKSAASDRVAAQGASTNENRSGVQQLVSFQYGERVIGLQHDRRPGCFGVEFSDGYGEEPFVSYGDSGCISGRSWHVVIGAGGRPGQVDWTVVMGAVMPEVERVVVSTPTREREVELEPIEGWKERLFRIGVDEAITGIAAYDSADRPLVEAEIPDISERPCDWLCESQGAWATQFDLDRRLERADFARHGDLDLLSRASVVRVLLENKRFYVSKNEDWGGCVGVERGGSWRFTLDEGDELARETWRTVDPDGQPIAVRASKPAEEVVVDFDRANGKVVSVLPYLIGGASLAQASPVQAPLATDEPYEGIEAAKNQCRPLW